MSKFICKSTVFPCPAGVRCPEHKKITSLIQQKDFKAAFKLIEEKKNPQEAIRSLPPLETLKVNPSKPTSEAAITLRNGIMLAPSRTYGEVYVEPVIRKIFGLKEPETRDYDGYDAETQKKYEIKSSKVLLSQKEISGKERDNLYDVIAGRVESDVLSRMVSYADRKTANYDSNIQNVKRDHFDYLIYNLLFEEGMQTFQISKDEINKEKISNWSDKHGRYDEHGKSGQFSIKCGNIEEHEKKRSISFFTWEELVPYYKDLN